MNWKVVLDKKPTVDDFRADYFPRKFRYKDSAKDLVAEVKAKGGEAHIEKEIA
jgi:hypothetical protein